MLDRNINCFLFPKLITKATITTINSENCCDPQFELIGALLL